MSKHSAEATAEMGLASLYSSSYSHGPSGCEDPAVQGGD